MTGPFKGCIGEALDKGEIDKASADLAHAAYDDAYAAADAAFSPADADRAAATAALDALQAADLRKRQLRALTIRTRREALRNLAEFKRRRGYEGVTDHGGGGKPPKDGWIQGGEPPKGGPYRGGKAAADFLIELVDGQGGLAGAPGASVKGRYQAIRGSFDAMMAEVGERFESAFGFDTPGKAVLQNVVREAFGEGTGDAAAQMLAKAWAETAEHARLMFNAAGGGIGKIERWGLPQVHDSLAVRKAGKDAWVDATAPLLDRGQMIDRVTGQAFTDKRLRAVLGDVWEQIASEGAVGREPGEHLGQGMLANRHADARFLVYKDADAWMAYQQAFGRADPYAAMMQHLDRMARDVAQLQVLGPNPGHQFDWLARFAEREARIETMAGAPKADENAASAIDTARRMYGLFTGELAGPYGRENRLALVSGALRAYLSAAQLGSAVINDVVSNPVFAAKTRAFTGLSKTGDFKAWASYLASPEARSAAHRTGFILEGARRQLSASAQDFLRSRTVGEKVVNGANWFARRVPTAIYRLELMSPNIAASRFSFQHEFMGALADRQGMSLAQMLGSADAEDRAFGQVLQARGFTEGEWAAIRAIEPEAPAKGASFLSPTAIGKVNPELGLRVAEMIERQTRLAVPEPSLWAQAHLIGHTRPGTVQGEFMRSLAAYRSFTVTQTYLWARELAAQGMTKDPAAWGPTAAAGMAGAAASLIVPLTLTGALGLQIRELVKGNDPRDMGDGRFWGAALLYGGGLGIAGDFLYASQARNGKTSALTAMGAPAAFLSDSFDLTVGNVREVAAAMTDADDPKSFTEAMDKANPGRDAARMAGRYTPVSSLWWARAAWDRSVVDQLQKLLDPDAADSFQRQARALDQNYGQTQWWPEGAPAPARAPDAAGAVQ